MVINIINHFVKLLPLLSDENDHVRISNEPKHVHIYGHFMFIKNDENQQKCQLCVICNKIRVKILIL